MSIPSSPATFNSASTSWQAAVSFAIPAGTYASGTWSVQGTLSGAGTGTYVQPSITTNSHAALSGHAVPNGSYGPFNFPVTSQQLADINAAAGGTLNATYIDTNYSSGHTGYPFPLGGTDAVSALTLTLVAGSGPPTDATHEADWASGYQATSGYTAAPNLIDGLNAVLPYQVSGPSGGTAALSGHRDVGTGLGSSRPSANSIGLSLGYTGTPTFLLEGSNDDATWTAISFSGGLSLPTHHGFAWEYVTPTFTAAQNWRYWRFSLQDSAPSGIAAQAALAETEVYSGNSGTGTAFLQSPGTGPGTIADQTYCPPAGTLSVSGHLSAIAHIYYTIGYTHITNRLNNYPACTGPMTTPQAVGVNVSLATLRCQAPQWETDGAGSSACVDGIWTVQTAVTDSNGNFSFSVTDSILQAILIYGKLIPNPAWQPGQPGYIIDTTNCWNLDLWSGPAAQWCFTGNINPSTNSLAPVDNARGDDSMLTATSDASTYCGQIPPGTMANNHHSTVPVDRCWSANQPPNWAFLVAGTLQVYDTVRPSLLVRVVRRVNGNYQIINGVTATITDDLGNSDTITTQDLFSDPGASILVGHGLGVLTNVVWNHINSVTLTTSTLPDCADSHSQVAQTVSGRPDGDINGGHNAPPVTTTCFGIYPNVPVWGNVCPYGLEFLIIELDGSACNNPGYKTSADVYNGVLTMAWVDGSGNLNVGVHRAPHNAIGNATQGWEPIATIASGVSGCGVLYFPDGQLFVMYDGGYYRRSERGGSQNTFDNAVLVPGGPSYFAAQGRAMEAAWGMLRDGSGQIRLTRYLDRIGTDFTVPAPTACNCSVLYFGGAWMEDRWGILYTGDGTTPNPGHIYWQTSAYENSWPGAPGTDTGMVGEIVALSYTDAGVLVGLLWDSTSHLTTCCRSYDKGLTWQKDSSTISAIPQLAQPPYITQMDGVCYAVFTQGNAPMFAASQDAGHNWS